ncbi:MAG TPA: mechanosensitive ion channel domain-containing protein [Bacteroidales bacterium]|nr:mechanosensitive ion channel domain-containing protein [Bacteroidales bacterium]
MKNFDFNLSHLYPMAISFGLKLLLAIVTLLIGLWVIKVIMRMLRKTMERRDVDVTLRQFLLSVLGVVLKIMLVITVITMVGIEMTSFVAILAAAGLAVGMALSGTLQNFAGGVIIVLFKPFKVGDFITAQGFTGTVREIQIFNTIVKTTDNVTVIIPNGPLSTNPVTNFSLEAQRRTEMVFGIGYGDDIDKARDIIKALFAADDRILKDPEPFIAVTELADSSVNFTVRLWAEPANLWGMRFDFIENVKKAFDREGISIPFPQSDVHLHQIKE